MRQPDHDPASVVGIERAARGKPDRCLHVEVRHEGAQVGMPDRQPTIGRPGGVAQAVAGRR